VSDSNKVKVTVRIFGDPYTVQSDDASEYVHEIAAYVDETITAIQNKDIYLSRTHAAVFGALKIADQYAKLKKDYEELLAILSDEPPASEIDPDFRRRRKRGKN